ncbi:MAG TPA: HNH endonuclease [Polyangiaceae bacterium LLY-WYZ-14_1]|nr:HNH endonuclease [Polyangiaceae bacterium LLY-WYZ-14_1]
MRTLVLDLGYQPHRIVPWQRAVCMWFGGKVEVVEEYEDLIASVNLVIRMPAVVRLLRNVRVQRNGVKFSRFNVMLRDGFTCQYCQRTLPVRELTCDHVLPRTRGGATGWENIVTACRPCNERKGNRTPAEAAMLLPAPPKAPRWLPALAVDAQTPVVPEPWRFWVHPAA